VVTVAVAADAREPAVVAAAVAAAAGNPPSLGSRGHTGP
jgi:hypothetical protein